MLWNIFIRVDKMLQVLLKTCMLHPDYNNQCEFHSTVPQEMSIFVYNFICSIFLAFGDDNNTSNRCISYVHKSLGKTKQILRLLRIWLLQHDHF